MSRVNPIPETIEHIRGYPNALSIYKCLRSRFYQACANVRQLVTSSLKTQIKLRAVQRTKDRGTKANSEVRGSQVMRVATRTACVACSLFVCRALPAAVADVTIIYNVIDPESGTQLRHKYISPGRAEAWAGPDYGFITDSTGKMTRIDHARREYTETTDQEDEAAQRTLLQRRIDRDKPADTSTSLEKVPGRRTIAGYNCDHYVATIRTQWNDGRPQPVVVNTHDYWIAPDLHLETVRARMFEMGARILGAENTLKEVLGKGLVLADIWSVNGSWVGSEEAIEIRKGAIGPSVFAPPAGYAKIESLAATLIQASSNAEFSAVGACSHTLFMAVGGGDDKDVAWDAAKGAWRSCVTGRLGEKWTFTNEATKRCFPREKSGAYAMVTAQGTETVACDQFGGNPNGKWSCHYDAVACTAPAAAP